jgi:hypothetical protein
MTGPRWLTELREEARRVEAIVHEDGHDDWRFVEDDFDRLLRLAAESCESPIDADIFDLTFERDRQATTSSSAAMRFLCAALKGLHEQECEAVTGLRLLELVRRRAGSLGDSLEFLLTREGLFDEKEARAFSAGRMAPWRVPAGSLVELKRILACTGQEIINAIRATPASPAPARIPARSHGGFDEREDEKARYVSAEYTSLRMEIERKRSYLKEAAAHLSCEEEGNG